MARIIYTALVESIRGSIAGTTFQRNAYGYTIKAKPNMVRPNRQSQQQAKISVLTVSTYWRSMSSTDRAAWATWAELFPLPSRLNPSSNLSGFDYFLKYHLLRRQTGNIEFVEDPGVTAYTFELDNDVIESNGSTILNYLLEFESDSDDWALVLQLTPTIPPSRNVARFTPRFIQGSFVDPGTPPALAFDIDITTNYLALYPTLLQAGDQVGVRIILLGKTNGQIVVVPTRLLTVVAL